MDQSNYIKRIEIVGLWSCRNITWNLNRDVNILSGINGSGKSTIIQCLASMFRRGKYFGEKPKLIDSVIVELENGVRLDTVTASDEKSLNVDVISTFDATLKESETLRKLSDGEVTTDLDWNLYQIQKRYLSYQLAQGKIAFQMLQNHAPQEEIDKILRIKTDFFDCIDRLFEKTGKRVDRNCDELQFTLGRRTLSAYQLSAGEKQMLLILTTVLTEARRPFILLMDEPEISLHFDWQQELIELIVRLNPQVQVIMATHSPAVIMNGWLEHVSEISDLVVD